MGINLLVFAVMFRWSPIIPLMQGPSVRVDLLQRSSTATSVSLWRMRRLGRDGGGQWWRLVTACFVHASILHIATNMWCLWNLGLFGEPLLGSWGLAWVYLLTGMTGILLSCGGERVYAHDAIAVGASGAIFGIAGILIVLLSNRKLAMPWEELKSLRRQVILFAVINLALGIAPQFSAGLTSPRTGRGCM